MSQQATPSTPAPLPEPTPAQIVKHLPRLQMRAPLPKAPPRRIINAIVPNSSATSFAQPQGLTANASGARSLVPTDEPVGAKRVDALTCFPPLSNTTSCRHKVLQLGGGDDDLTSSLVSILAKADVDCANFDPANGRLRDLVDSYALGLLLRDAEAGEYMAALATPDCSTFPTSLGPGGPSPLRGKTGGDRYGFKANSIDWIGVRYAIGAAGPTMELTPEYLKQTSDFL